MYAIVDLETTGGNPANDRIIEIAIYIHDGRKIIDSFSSLVDPGVQIPFYISRLTGITDDMVARAPDFTELAEVVHGFLSDHIFVAHNVNFDYSFLSYALNSAGYPYEQKMLCTCKTARVMFPGLPSYSLSKICNALTINLDGAHRAAADALATTQLLEMIIEKSGGVLEPYYTCRRRPVNKSNIPDAQLERLPSKAGVLYFYDETGELIYVASATNLRKKAQFIIGKMHTRKFAGLAALAVSVDFEITGGVLLSSIREIETINTLNPKFNKPVKSFESRFSIYENLTASGYLVLEKEKYVPGAAALVTLPSEQEASRLLDETLRQFRLLPASEIIRANERMCNEPPGDYNSRAEEAIKEITKQKRNFIITDRGPVTDHQSMVVIADGRYTGYIFADREQSRARVDELLELKKHATDQPTVFKSIVKHVSQGKYGKIINF